MPKQARVESILSPMGFVDTKNENEWDFEMSMHWKKELSKLSQLRKSFLIKLNIKHPFSLQSVFFRIWPNPDKGQ